MSNENEPTDAGEREAVSRPEFEQLANQVAKNDRDNFRLQLIFFAVPIILIIGLMLYAMNLEDRINDLTARRDDVSSSYQPLQNLLDAGPHCYESGAEAIAAQTRIFTAIDLEYLRDGVETRFDHRLNPGVGGSIDSVYMPVLPDVSKTSRNEDGKTCFTVTWPRDTKPRWAGGY